MTDNPIAGDQTGTLPANAGAVLLQLARNAIASELGSSTAVRLSEAWMQDAGASFVTLKIANKLRGCIGSLQAHRALGEDVRANAVSAAFRDPRFKPLTHFEFAAINVEVSVLSKLEPLAFQSEDDVLAQLRPGTDGIILEYGHHRSTFLPQVWDEYGDPKLFLGHLKYKAGLPPDFWEPGVSISRYTVTRWRESSAG